MFLGGKTWMVIAFSSLGTLNWSKSAFWGWIVLCTVKGRGIEDAGN